MRQPNIVLIMADQLPAGFVGCYGSKVNSTPMLDRLAAEGMRFDRCYATIAVCAPNRATILTGRSVAVHGVATNNMVLTTDNPTYAQLLQRHGYRTGGFGKFHLTSMSQPLPVNFGYLGFDESVPTEDPKLGAWLDWVEREHPEHYEAALAVSWPMPYLEEYGPERRNLRPAWEAARAKILAPLSQVSPWWLMHPSPLPKDLHQTTYITGLGLDFMRRHLDEHPDRPLFCCMSYVDPHDPYDPPAPYDTMFDPNEMIDPIPMDGPKHRCESLERSRDFAGFRALDGNAPALRKLRALYHGSIRLIDDQIARIVEFLDHRGLREDTIIVFTADHGDMMGDHGLINKGVKHYDKGIRCPLIVSGSSVRRGVDERLVCSLDFFPTFCDWAGVRLRPPLEGKSFAPACAGEVATDRWAEVTVESAPFCSAKAVRTILTEDNWRLTIFQAPGEGQMFNLTDDPEERCDLYDDPAYAGKKVELLARHARAFMRESTVPQLRNLPIHRGKRYTPGDTFEIRHDEFQW